MDKPKTFNDLSYTAPQYGMEETSAGYIYTLKSVLLQNYIELYEINEEIIRTLPGNLFFSLFLSFFFFRGGTKSGRETLRKVYMW